ncbi:MAG: type IV secretory system conjugative DNA transfer family protein [Candidatus Gallimonas sp.]
MKKLGFYGVIILVCLCLSAAFSFGVLWLGKLFSFPNLLRWTLFWFVMFMFVSNLLFVHKFTSGKKQEVLFFIVAELLISNLFGYAIYCLIECGFDLARLDWLGFLNQIVAFDLRYYGIVLLIFLILVVVYCKFVDPKMLNFMKSGIHGKGKLKQVESNLENSRWMTKEERDKLFQRYKFSKLGEVKKDGIPVMAKLTAKDRDMDVCFNSPCHTLVIGSTGSGKTTTFVSPMIQLLGASAAGSSMVVTDPKGELFSLHSKFLKERGYDVKVIDLRDTYSSYRWNPLEMIWDNYEKYRNAPHAAFARRGDPAASGLVLAQPVETFQADERWYEFDGKAYSDYNRLVEAIKVYKKKIFDEVYEDLNDLVSVLIPVENEKDPMWEKGARSITLATLLAMLEDSADERLGMTKEKFNFFNMTKILQNSSKDYLELRNYFAGRSILSKAYSLSKQVCDAAEQTRASYMSIVYEKLTMFNDAGICALTSASDFSSEQLAQKPTALFLKIPDEKDTRHNLAAIFILNIYKTLIKVASATEELTLPRNVYFIMDEFGNMPKIEKFDKFITVGRSRKIWFTMIVQSYAQLNNVYGETVADIVKGNCGIKMFIGSNDMNTCKEYSELCGNITVVTSSTSGSVSGTDVNLSNQTQVRPLIYPSELQRLNHPGDIGHSIIVTFGNYPLKTYFSPSFKVPFYKTGKMDTSELSERYFDENAVVYKVAERNRTVLNKEEPADGQTGGKPRSAEKKPADGKTSGKSADGRAESAARGVAPDGEAQTTKRRRRKTEQDADGEELRRLTELWKEYKKGTPTGTLEEFYAIMANKTKEGTAQ